MNDAQSLYLSSYGGIDNIEKLFKFCRVKMCSWKYWHVTTLHAKALTCAVAYNTYCECAEGNLNPAWKIDKPLMFWQFQDKLGRQLLVYDPTFNHYLVIPKTHSKKRKGSTVDHDNHSSSDESDIDNNTVDHDSEIEHTISDMMEEWEANPFSTLGFIVSVVVKN